jgi:CRISPR-associated protein Cmr4
MSARANVGGLLGLHALTSLHPGAGTALDVIDLPVQRERHTQWPTVPGTALKGVLRDAARHGTGEASLDQADRHEDVTSAFGPPTAEADKHAGALSFTDARILAFPVRSLKGVFAWTCCPAVLERLQRDAAIARIPAGWRIPPVNADQALVTNDAINVASNRVVLEEYDFARIDGDVTAIADWIADQLLPRTDAFEATRSRLRRAFVLLSDDDFTHFARHATEVTARIALDAETKTVRKGALFYQELLPAETLLYSVVLASPSRSARAMPASTVMAYLRKVLPPVVQIGGDETTGKGLCATRLDAQAEG